MAFSSVSAKTTFAGIVPFTAAQQATILAAMQTAYDGSATAKTMFDNWINAGKTIGITNLPGFFQAFANTGLVEIDLAYLANASYIDTTGTAVQDTLVTALVHELGHALTGKLDNDATSAFSVKTTDYRGDNVNFVNLIYKELGLPQQVSYVAYDTTGLIHKLNYQYTNGATIDAAQSGDININSALLGTSRDLLIGGLSNNILQSGAGDDFLFGAGGNDQLDGGTGIDTAVYFGKELDYDIRQNTDGSWAVNNVRGAKNTN
jgi:Ca2+-binding RTX toxin-like protein